MFHTVCQVVVMGAKFAVPASVLLIVVLHESVLLCSFIFSQSVE